MRLHKIGKNLRIHLRWQCVEKNPVTARSGSDNMYYYLRSN